MPLMKRGNLSSQYRCTSSEFLHRDNLLQIPQWHGIWGLSPMHGKLYIHQQSGIMPHSPLSPQWDDDAATTLQIKSNVNARAQVPPISAAVKHPFSTQRWKQGFLADNFSPTTTLEPALHQPLQHSY